MTKAQDYAKLVKNKTNGDMLFAFRERFTISSSSWTIGDWFGWHYVFVDGSVWGTSIKKTESHLTTFYSFY